MGEQLTELSIRLQMAPEYVLGLPFFVEVTLSNETEGSEYYNLLHCDPFSPPFPIEVAFWAKAERVTLPARSVSMGGATRKGFDLLPGEARTFVVDLSELEPALVPGSWQCQAQWVMRYEKPRSTPVPVTLKPASAEDLSLLARLRSLGGAPSPSWANFIKSPSVPEMDEAWRGLSEQAKLAAAPYLVVHQAVHGQEPLAAFPPQLLAQDLQGPWASEAGILSYEVLWSRQAPDLARQRDDLLRRWPGLAFRVEQVEAGGGLLTVLRSEYGPDRGG